MIKLYIKNMIHALKILIITKNLLKELLEYIAQRAAASA